MKTKITDEIVEAAANIGQFGLGAVLVAADKIESEHAALVAVAEAAKLISEGDVMRMNPSFTHADTVLAYQKLMRQALANLAAVQKGAGK